MQDPDASPHIYRFAAFILNTRTGELTQAGTRVPLREKTLQLLMVLIEQPGELVTRDELVRRLWPAGTFVDFERGLNKTINHLRETLGDSAEQPSFIETLPRKGYRFIASVTHNGQASEGVHNSEPPGSGVLGWIVTLGALVACVGIVVSTNIGGARDWIRSQWSSSPQISALAVLPLENLSGDPEQAFFADGMTDALITEVARDGTTRVISRTTILRYKGTRKNTLQIGRELNVDAVVEGTVLRSGNHIRITAQLIQVSTDTHLWAQSYERDATEVLRLQHEVASDIARRIGHLVKPVEPLRTVDPEAYGQYLQGRFYFFEYTAEGWRKAIEHYRLAIKADPNFAPAHAGLAESYVVAWAFNAFPLDGDQGLRKGKTEAQKALELDPKLASAHLALGEVYVQDWDHENAERELGRALELNPNDPLAWQLHGIHRLWLGQIQEGIAEQERARSLDPFSPIINANLARAFCYSRQYDKAIAQAQETLKMEPGYPVALAWLEHAYRHKGMFKEALVAHLAAAKPEAVPMIESAYRSSGYRGVLLLQAEADKRSGNLSKAARGYAQAGDKEQALALLEECYRHHCPGLGRANVEPDFDPIRLDPRYQDLLRRIGYSE